MNRPGRDVAPGLHRPLLIAPPRVGWLVAFKCLIYSLRRIISSRWRMRISEIVCRPVMLSPIGIGGAATPISIATAGPVRGRSPIASNIADNALTGNDQVQSLRRAWTNAVGQNRSMVDIRADPHGQPRLEPCGSSL